MLKCLPDVRNFMAHYFKRVAAKMKAILNNPSIHSPSQNDPFYMRDVNALADSVEDLADNTEEFIKISKYDEFTLLHPATQSHLSGLYKFRIRLYKEIGKIRDRMFLTEKEVQMVKNDVNDLDDISKYFIEKISDKVQTGIGKLPVGIKNKYTDEKDVETYSFANYKDVDQEIQNEFWNTFLRPEIKRK